MKRPLRLCLAGWLLLAPALLSAQRVSPKPLAMPSPGYPEELTDTGFNGAAEVDFAVKADGSAPPTLFLRHAWSPSVVR